MDVVQKPQLHLYWSQNPLLKASVFRVVMPINRFQAIIAFLHFGNNRDYDSNDSNRARFVQGLCSNGIYCL